MMLGTPILPRLAILNVGGEVYLRITDDALYEQILIRQSISEFGYELQRRVNTDWSRELCEVVAGRALENNIKQVALDYKYPYPALILSIVNMLEENGLEVLK